MLVVMLPKLSGQELVFPCCCISCAICAAKRVAAVPVSGLRVDAEWSVTSMASTAGFQHAFQVQFI